MKRSQKALATTCVAYSTCVYDDAVGLRVKVGSSEGNLVYTNCHLLRQLQSQLSELQSSHEQLLSELEQAREDLRTSQELYTTQHQALER